MLALCKVGTMGPMHKEVVTLPDGRYLIYYTFERR